MVRVSRRKKDIEAWISLVHVCRRWRCVIFGSPRRLNLRLLCTSETTIENLDVWPALPLQIECDIYSIDSYTMNENNIVVALGYRDRVCRIDFRSIIEGAFKWEPISAAMQVPFPALTDLLLHGYDDYTAPIIPDTFLGGSAPRLRYGLHLISGNTKSTYVCNS
jgi:hypothetical protein